MGQEFRELAKFMMNGFMRTQAEVNAEEWRNMKLDRPLMVNVEWDRNMDKTQFITDFCDTHSDELRNSKVGQAFRELAKSMMIECVKAAKLEENANNKNLNTMKMTVKMERHKDNKTNIHYGIVWNSGPSSSKNEPKEEVQDHVTKIVPVPGKCPTPKVAEKLPEDPKNVPPVCDKQMQKVAEKLPYHPKYIPPVCDKTIPRDDAHNHTTTDIHNSLGQLKFEAEKEKLLPDLIRCKCGREEQLEDMFDCVTCSEYGFCSLCSMKMHRNHEIKDSLPNVLVNLVSERSAEVNDKLKRWGRNLQIIHKMGSEAHAELCDRLEAVFTDAMTSENVQQIEEALANCDISVLDECFTDMLEIVIKTIERVKEFSGKLPGPRKTSNTFTGSKTHLLGVLEVPEYSLEYCPK